MTDYQIENHGSIFLVHAMNAHADKHLKDSVSSEAQWFGNALAVEPRYIADLVMGLHEEGYECRAAGLRR